MLKIFTGTDGGETGNVGTEPFYNWLLENVDGTFLKNAQFDYTTGAPWDELMISVGGAVFHLCLSKGNAERYEAINKDIAWIDPKTSGKVLSFQPYNASSCGYRWISLNSAYLCKNGLILHAYYRIRTYDYTVYATTRNILVLSTDEDGKLIMGFIDPSPGTNNGSGTESPPSGFYVCSKDSIAVKYNANPWNQQGFTNIHQVALLTGTGETEKSTNLFVADATQCITYNYTGVYTVALGGVVYMTNGIWYVKDE